MIQRQRMDLNSDMQSGYHENGQGRPKQDGKTQPHPPPGSCVARNSYRQTSVETDRGGVPPYLAYRGATDQMMAWA